MIAHHLMGAFCLYYLISHTTQQSFTLTNSRGAARHLDISGPPCFSDLADAVTPSDIWWSGQVGGLVPSQTDNQNLLTYVIISPRQEAVHTSTFNSTSSPLVCNFQTFTADVCKEQKVCSHTAVPHAFKDHLGRRISLILLGSFWDMERKAALQKCRAKKRKLIFQFTA